MKANRIARHTKRSGLPGRFVFWGLEKKAFQANSI
jgi:hypothetical protein